MNKIEDFRQYLSEQERSKETIASYTTSVKKFFENYEEISKENMLAFKQMQLELHKPGTAALRCVGMNVYCEFIGRPECKVKGVRIHNRTHLENVITLEEYRFFLDCLKKDGNLKLYNIIRFLAVTGCRISELVKVRRSSLEKGEMTIWTKGKIRSIIIPRAFAEECREYAADVDSVFLFPSYRGSQMTTRGVSSQIVKYGLKYGIRREVLHAHAFRHLFALQFLNANSNLSLLQNLLGHESINTTAVYLKLSKEEQRSEVNNTVKW